MSSNSEIMITHSQAACVFFGDLLTPENEALNEARIAAYPDVELCYIDVPTEPFLVASSRINFFPFRYKRYRPAELGSLSRTIEEVNEETNEEIACETNDIVIHSESQLIEFINNIFLINDPQNEKVYERLDMSSEEIFTIIKQYTSLYQDKNIQSFVQFAKKRGVKYLDAEVSRKRNRGGRIKHKILYVMKKKDRAFLVQNIVNYQSKYERFIDKLKKDGFEVVGYVRKSPCKLSNDALKDNLQKMIECLRERSLVEFVYVSPRSCAGSPINSRDMSNTVDELEKMELRHCAGSTQTLLSKLSANIKKVCLVIVDYAALSTDADDIRTLVTNYHSLECIIVDRFRQTGKYEVYSRDKMLNNNNYLKPFACRKALPHRSK